MEGREGKVGRFIGGVCVGKSESGCGVDFLCVLL